MKHSYLSFALCIRFLFLYCFFYSFVLFDWIYSVGVVCCFFLETSRAPDFTLVLLIYVDMKIVTVISSELI